MEERDTTTSKKFSVFAILAFAVAVFLCLVELGWVDTPVDAFLQRCSALLGVFSKPAIALWRWLF